MLLKGCVVAFQCYPPGLTLRQEQCLCWGVKGCPGIDSDFVRHGGANSKLHPWESLKLQSGLADYKQLSKTDSLIMPMVTDMQVPMTIAASFSFQIAKGCTRQTLQFIKAATAEAEKGGGDIPLLSDMMQLQLLAIDAPQQSFAPPLFYQSSESNAEKSVLDFVGDLVLSSKLVVQPDGQVFFSSSGAEIKDILSVFTEFYLSKNSLKRTKPTMLIPCYNGVNINAETSTQSIKVEPLAVAPTESPKKIKVKSSGKKKNGKKASRERDLYEKNYFHACESLLSLIIDQKRGGKKAFLSLKKSGLELPELLTKFSAGIAGTGIALLFSVVCKVACGRVPFCAYKLLNTSFGFGLVWLSWAVNRLKDTIVYISKNTGKLGLKDEELLVRVDENMREIRFRAAALLVVAVLRLA